MTDGSPTSSRTAEYFSAPPASLAVLNLMDAELIRSGEPRDIYKSGTVSPKIMTTTTDVYGGADARELPAYSFWDVALSLRLPVSTLRAWTRGQPGFQPLFDIPRDSSGLFELSFYNLIESYVIVQLRRKHGLAMKKVRWSIEYLQNVLDVEHPIVEADMFVVGTELFMRYGRHSLSLTRSGQLPIEGVIRDLLTRVDKGPFGFERFYPQVENSRGLVSSRYKPIVIDPEVTYGRPRIAGTGIPTAAIAERYRANESIPSIAKDFYTTVTKVRAALAFEDEEVATGKAA